MISNESNLLYSMLVILLTLSIITIVITTVPLVYGHTFSQNENSLFLTRMDQIHSQLQLVQNFLPTNATSGGKNMNNTKFAFIHAMESAALLKEKDPVTKFTWNQEIAERNQRVANDLVRGLSDLTAFLTHETSSKINPKIALANESSSSVRDKIYNLSGLLDEAVSARVAKDIVNNSTNQALILSNIGNEIFYSYGQALGFPYARLANMVSTMNISAMSGGSNNMNLNGKEMMQNMNDVNGNGNKIPNMSNKINILNESDYQNAKAYVKQAQAYVKQAQEIVSKYLRSPVSENKNSSADVRSQLNKILSQLETTMDDSDT